MKRELLIDTETFSPTPIKHGTHKYSEAAEVMILAYALDDPLLSEEGPIHVLDLANGDVLPTEFLDALADPEVIVVGHNFSMFDRVVLRAALALDIAPERIEDTMVQAQSHGLPGGLDKLCQIFNVPEALAKHQGGRSLIQLFCQPRPKNMAQRRATKDTHPVEWERFLRYAGGDISSMRYLRKVMPRWNYPGKPKGNQRYSDEHRLWLLDQKINDRGFEVDLDLAEAAVNMVTRHKKHMAERCVTLTEGEVKAATQRDALLTHLLMEYGVTLPDMQKSTLERRLQDEELPWAVRELVALRLEASGTSQSKYQVALNSTSSDGRMRGTLVFCGAARTGRWAGRLFQPQNLPRPNMDAAEIEEHITLVKSGSGDLLLDDPMRSASNAIRGCIVAKPGHKLVVADLANIEGRVLAWLAGEQWKLQAFRDYDAGTGHDLYKITAGGILGKRPEDVTKDERQAQGKVPELACFGPDTLVLTQRGPIAIVDVTESDLLWDGVEWVQSQGVINRGRKRVIRLDGLLVTPEHLVLRGSQWCKAQEVLSSQNALALVLATGLESLSLLASTSAQWAGFAQLWCRVRAGEPATASNSETCVVGLQPDAGTAETEKQVNGARSGIGTRMSSRMMRTDAGCAAAYRLRTIGATTRTTKLSITTAVGGYSFTNLGDKIAAFFSRILSLCRVGITQTWRWIGLMLTEVTSPVTCALSPKRKITPTDVQPRNYNSASCTWSNVYDIAHAGPRNRFTVLTDSGAMVVHNCGYQGAAGAFKSMAALYGLTLPDSRVKEIVDGWRRTNSAIVQFWYDMDSAAREAILQPGTVTSAGRIRFHKQGNWLRMQLPSGRFLCYADPALVEHPKFDRGTSISYMGLNSYTRRWERLHTYGGKLTENVVQAAARDVMAHNAEAIEEAGFPIVLSVHDEIITEPVDTPEFSKDRLEQLLAATPFWADETLPLAAAGAEMYRYAKTD